MKNLFLLIAVTGTLFLTSCEKCYTCTNAAGEVSDETCTSDSDLRDAAEVACERIGGTYSEE